MDSALPASDPEAILQAEINLYVQMGFGVTSQTTRSAQLVKPKKFSIMWAIVWFTLAIFPLLIYLLYYGFKWDHRVYLTVDEEGHITQTRGLAGEEQGSSAA
jgi:ABC-type Fe3+ transport system permease subunit